MTNSTPPDPAVLDRLDSLLADRKHEDTTIGMHFGPEFMQALSVAAAARGVSLSGYVRRAALSFAAHDLGIDRDVLMQFEPPLRPAGHFGGGARLGPETRAGRGLGLWRIAELAE